MSIQLPDAADVAGALVAWQAEDGRLTQLLDRYGVPAPALRHFGLVLWQDGQLERASRALIGALALKPDDARAWTDLAGILGAMGGLAEAATCLEEGLRHDPTPAQPWLQLGAVRNGLGQADAAIAAYEQALGRDPTLADGWLGLGLLHLAAKRYEFATSALAEAATRRGGDAAIHACLGEAHYGAGRFAEATIPFADALRLDPSNAALRFKRAQAAFVAGVLDHGVDAAVTALEATPLDASEREKIVHDAFHLLSGFGHADAAIRLGEMRLSQKPDDAMQPYLLAALKGEDLTRAPDAYVVSYFDRFAEEFDHKLVDVLAYTAPRDLAALIDARGRPARRVLDLGCGTGLAGPGLIGPGRTLTGVDLSPRMLEKARQRGCYDTLVESEIAAFLATQGDGAHDVIVMADVLIYFGDMEPLVGAIARVLALGGLWAASIETTDVADRRLMPSGRFAHKIAYVTGLARAHGLSVLDVVDTTIRLETVHGVTGALLLFGKD